MSAVDFLNVHNAIEFHDLVANAVNEISCKGALAGRTGRLLLFQTLFGKKLVHC